MPGILEAYIPQQVAMPKVQWGTPDGEEMQAPPAMFIGVGGSGGQMVRMIRSRLLSQLGVIPDGVEMLVRQGAMAFELWTGIDAPVGVMRAAVLGELGREKK